MRIARDEALTLLVFCLVGFFTMRFFDSQSGIVLLMVIAIATAVYNINSSTLKHKLYSYIWQSASLVPLAMLRFFETTDGGFWLVALFLAVRVFVIPILMALATVQRSSYARDNAYFARQSTEQSRSWLKDAQEYWLIYGETRVSSVFSLGACGAFIGLAYLVAMRVQSLGRAPESPVGLGAAISLLLIGLFAMINERELPSQVVGLLIMENGLFLAAAIFITDPYFLVSFWSSMATFFFITFFILWRFVPGVHSVSGSAQIDDQNKLKEVVDKPQASAISEPGRILP